MSSDGSPAAPETCSGNVHLHVVEEQSLCGTEFSCIPEPNRFVAKQIHVAHFCDERSFESHVFDAFRRMHTLGGASAASLQVDGDALKDEGLRHVLVISGHGKEKTGTAIDLPTPKRSLNMHLVDVRLFEIRPQSLVVFLSACWGAYPGLADAFRHGDHSPRPTVVGPLVPVHPRHANELQKAIVQQLCNRGYDEAALACLVRQANRELRARYRCAPFRIILRSGAMCPSQGKGGLASRLILRSHLVVAIHRALNPSGVEYAVLLGADGYYWIAPFHQVAPAKRVGDKVVIAAKNHWCDGLHRLGGITDIEGVQMDTRPPRFFAAYRPPFPHCWDDPVPRSGPRTMPLPALGTCKRCNWARLQNQRIRAAETGVVQHAWSLLCFRDSCPLHTKFAGP